MCLKAALAASSDEERSHKNKTVPESADFEAICTAQVACYTSSVVSVLYRIPKQSITRVFDAPLNQRHKKRDKTAPLHAVHTTQNFTADRTLLPELRRAAAPALQMPTALSCKLDSSWNTAPSKLLMVAMIGLVAHSTIPAYAPFVHSPTVMLCAPLKCDVMISKTRPCHRKILTSQET